MGPATSNGKVKKVKKGRPPPIDKLLKPAIGVALALLAYQFIKGLSSEISRVSTSDDIELREVFFGEGDDNNGKSYAVLCHDDGSSQPLSSVFVEAWKDGSSPAHFRIIDCNYVLPSSEKSIANRFKLDLDQRPTIFLSGAVHDEPKQIPAKYLKTGAHLVKYLRGKLETRAAKLETTQDLRSKCLAKPTCGLLLKGSTTAPKYLKDAMSKLLTEYPDVTFAVVDASVFYVYNLEDQLPELFNEEPRFVVFSKVSGSLDPKGDRLITSFATLPTNGATYGPMSNLVAGVLNKSTTLTKLTSLPQIKTRSKKLVEEERAKRQRRSEQRQRHQSTPTEDGGATANDGSREGRRLERERRRAAHHAAHNVKPKTPEEIAEMERQRRARMQTEADKWSMKPEDAPSDEGSADDGGDFWTDDADEDVSQHVDDGDDEDVMDLD